ncbi:MAG: glucan 1,4-alpha-glucosidase [Gemmatimonadetes bacterium]|nr:glucan 1,4-alpha-glucosidase [Gemmatimonadota bacterium]
MARFRGTRDAFGKPGHEPRWSQGDKDGVGTAYSADSRIWFTLHDGAVTEVYYPVIDRPQVRDLQLLVTDGESFFHEERRDLLTRTERCSPHALGYRVTNSDPQGRYRIEKEIISAPHQSCLLQRTRLEVSQGFAGKLRLYVLCNPHLEIGGWGNNAHVIEAAGRQLLAAEKDGVWLVIGATAPFGRLSCGYVGASDGWTDLAQNFQMDWEFDRAEGGNVALTGELDLRGGAEFTLGLALGHGLQHALSALFQALGMPYESRRKRFIEQWDRPCRNILPLEKVSGDGGNLYHGSYSLLMSHEDKTFAGAFIASLSIPWGEARGDEDMGGYHLVWTRDMVNTVTGLLAAGNTSTPLRALVYLAVSQQSDGGFPQNFWLNGEPYWRGIQLDQVSFPILLAWRLKQQGGLGEFDPYPMVMRAAAYLVTYGPATQQERWEEAGGFSPSTLAAHIGALICASCFARERGDQGAARYLEEYADFLEAHIEAWTVTTDGIVHPEIARHYIRILPADVHAACPGEDPNCGMLALANRPPGSSWQFPAKDIVDAGFLELVRYGIRRPDDPLIVDSLRVVDHVLRVETFLGPCWRRYNNDGYGQRADGGPYQGWGQGRAWPLLTGERAHYELAAGREVAKLTRTLEAFASPTGLLPEQIWDEVDRRERGLRSGRPTGAAMPLMWAHAEYIKLLRSVHDGRVFDLIPAAAERYLPARRRPSALEVWKFNRQVSLVRQGQTLRIQAGAPFRLRWTDDDWRTTRDESSAPTGLGGSYADIAIAADQRAPLRFTFYWPESDRWEGRDFEVAVREGGELVGRPPPSEAKELAAKEQGPVMVRDRRSLPS